ncbi:hypothetical protein RHGRI_016522 [Rhododendron griersonianum]|uniref:PIN-like protein n=1 Tax=Rhododendron griersonianum TaxID=479676 RepID=A0AAV6JUH2_9ERIC|nr:hypothetical protein RHGRI_016522 [Rhododendron griersonianum]
MADENWLVAEKAVRVPKGTDFNWKFRRGSPVTVDGRRGSPEVGRGLTKVTGGWARVDAGRWWLQARRCGYRARVASGGSEAGQMLSGIGFLWPVLMIDSSAFQAGASILKVVFCVVVAPFIGSVFIDAATRLKGKVLDIFVVNSFGSGFQALMFLSRSFAIRLRWSSTIAHPLCSEQHSIQHISAPSSKDFLCSPFFYCCNVLRSSLSLSLSHLSPEICRLH